MTQELRSHEYLCSKGITPHHPGPSLNPIVTLTRVERNTKMVIMKHAEVAPTNSDGATGEKYFNNEGQEVGKR